MKAVLSPDSDMKRMIVPVTHSLLNGSRHAPGGGSSVATLQRESLGAPLEADFARTRGHTQEHSAARQPAMDACPLSLASPRTCPFGGACHACPARIQKKLTINQPGDEYEQEADRVADAVMRMAEPSATVRSAEQQALSSSTRSSEPAIQDTSAAPPAVRAVLASPGRPLDPEMRAFMEPRFGRDFGHVRLHTDDKADRSARAIHALAFTVGKDLVFRSNRYSSSSDGRRLCAHELAHVVQQVGTPTVEFSRSASSRPGELQSRAATAPGPNRLSSFKSAAPHLQRLSVSDCSRDHGAEIRRAAAAAVPAIARTISAILEFPLRPPAADALRRFFGASGAANAAQIALRLAVIQHRIPGAAVECENPGGFMYDHFCEGVLAYVRPVPAFFGAGSIHVCQPAFHNLPAPNQMSTLVHEAAHRYNDASDQGGTYYTRNCGDTAKTRALSDRQRRNHADAYRCLVQTLG